MANWTENLVAFAKNAKAQFLGLTLLKGGYFAVY